MQLPGQRRPASRRFTRAVAEVEAQLGRRLVFLSIADGRGPATGTLIEGFHENADGEERIWLNPALPATAQEAIAAHELAHVLQEHEGYPRAAALPLPDGRVPPVLATLAARTKDLVLDQAADDWALARGFALQRAFQAVHLPRLLDELGRLQPAPEAHDWASYRTELQALVQGWGTALAGEASTQVRALDYASLSRRLERFGLFGELDALWARLWPQSRRLGLALAGVVARYGVGDAASARRTMRMVRRRLGLPAALMPIS